MEFFKVSILILVGIVALADVEAGGFCGNDVCSQNSCSRDTCSKATVLCCNDPCLEPIYSNATAHQVIPVKDPVKSVIGTSCFWDYVSQCFVYCDVNGTDFHILRHCPDCGKTYGAKIVGIALIHINFIMPVSGQPGNYTCGTENKIIKIFWNGVSPTAVVIEIILELDFGGRPVFISAAVSDCAGRLLFVERPINYCSDNTYTQLYSIRKESIYYGATQDVLISASDQELRLGNAMCFSPCGEKIYITDSCKANIREYRYNVTTGKIEGEGRVIYDYYPGSDVHDGLPAGLACGAHGTLFSTEFMKGHVKEIDIGTGQVVRTILIKSALPGSACFGGQHYDRLFITTGTTNSQGLIDGLVYETTCTGTAGRRQCQPYV